MGQMPGPSYPFQWSDRPPSPNGLPPERPPWWRWLLIACAALLLIVLAGMVAGSIVAQP